jgi:atypical dual specificity phosphatase
VSNPRDVEKSEAIAGGPRHLRKAIRYPLRPSFTMGTGGKFLRRVRAKVSDEPTGFVWVEDRKLAGSGYPASAAQLAWLQEKGIGALLSLTEDPLPQDWSERSPMVMAHVPMRDHSPPDAASLEKAVSFIEKESSEGRAVAVHCLAGEGRTGCVLAAYLVKSRGLGAAEALRIIRGAKPEFVERGQEKAVYDYAASLKPQASR